MRIAVTGPREGQLDPMRQAYTMLAVKHFAKQLGIQRLKLNIHVRLHEGLTLSFADSKDCEGLCEPISKRNFTIDVATWGDWITTLAHEILNFGDFSYKTALCHHLVSTPKRSYHILMLFDFLLLRTN